MASLARITCKWSGFLGAPGYTNFYFTLPGIDPGNVFDFFAAQAGSFPTGLTIEVPNQGDTIDEATGNIINGWAGAGGGVVTGTAGASAPGGAGMCINWHTDSVVNGRRVRGRTFMVPLSADSFEADGTPSALRVNFMKTQADALITNSAGEFVVYHRPVGGVGGSAHVVTRSAIRDRSALLRTRRD